MIVRRQMESYRAIWKESPDCVFVDARTLDHATASLRRTLPPEDRGTEDDSMVEVLGLRIFRVDSPHSIIAVSGRLPGRHMIIQEDPHGTK